MSTFFKTCLIQILCGIKDALHGVVLVPFLDRKIEQQREERWRKLQESMMARERSVASQRKWLNRIEHEQQIAKNSPRLLGRLFLAVSFGVLIWIILTFFSTNLMPLLQDGFEIFHKMFLKTTSSQDDMWYYAEFASYFFFNVFLILPLTLINKLAAGIWLLEIANLVYRHHYGQPKPFPSFSVALADFLYSIPLSFIFFVQGNAFNYLLVQSLGLHHLFYCFHISILYSLYAFEYKWYYMGIDLRVRLQLIEKNWPYFLGFGFPLYLATHLVSSTYSGYTYSSLFPFMVVSATRVSAPTTDVVVKLPILKPSAWLCSFLFRSSLGRKEQRPPLKT